MCFLFEIQNAFTGSEISNFSVRPLHTICNGFAIIFKLQDSFEIINSAGKQAMG